jgi:apocytochrome f
MDFMQTFKRWILGVVAMCTLQTGTCDGYPIYAQQAYSNPREATGRIVCANCHLAEKPVDIQVPQSVLPDSVFEANVRIPYDKQIKQVIATGQKGSLNVGAVMILPTGFGVASTESMSEQTKQKVGKLSFQPYNEDSPNILVVGPVPGKKYSEMSFPIESPNPTNTKNVSFIKYPIYVGANRGRGQLYPDGSKSNNTVYTATSTGTIESIRSTDEGGSIVRIRNTSTNEYVDDSVPAGPSLIVQVDQSVQADQPLTNNPNVGGFGQAETEVVLQNPVRVQFLVALLVFVLFAQLCFVLKKKQYEKVQLFSMNF